MPRESREFALTRAEGCAARFCSAPCGWPREPRRNPRANGWHPQPITVGARPESSQNGHRTPYKSLSFAQAAHRTPVTTILGNHHDICGTRLLPPRRLAGLSVWGHNDEPRLSATTKLIASAPCPLSPPPGSSRPPKRRDQSTPPLDGSYFPILKIIELAALIRSIAVHISEYRTTTSVQLKIRNARGGHAKTAN